MAKNLIIYYSRKGQNYVSGKLEDLEVGNTELIAQYIQDAVGADLFEIETVKDYPADYMECTEVAKQEQRDNARPKLKEYLHDISEYDNIVIAGPCWWGTYPCAVFGQLEKLHFRGREDSGDTGEQVPCGQRNRNPLGREAFDIECSS